MTMPNSDTLLAVLSRLSAFVYEIAYRHGSGSFEKTMASDFSLRVAPRSVQQAILDKLRLAIFSGTFRPGSRLVESQLSAQLGVSRPSLREALRVLQAERLIEIVPNRGPVVADLSWGELDAIYDVRELLEVEAVGRCAKLMTPDHLTDLEGALSAFEQAAKREDSLARVLAAAEFYAVILANCGNPILEEVHRGLVARISVFRGRSMSLDGRAHSSFEEMREIYKAIAAGDAKAARRQAKVHLQKAKAAAKRSMENEGSVA